MEASRFCSARSVSGALSSRRVRSTHMILNCLFSVTRSVPNKRFLVNVKPNQVIIKILPVLPFPSALKPSEVFLVVNEASWEKDFKKKKKI